MSVIGPGQNIMMSAALPSLVTAAEIEEYTKGGSKRVYMWGIMYYKDAFGKGRETKFCQSVVWTRDGSSMGINAKRHNEAT
jgi:hypothetical protein